MSVTSTPKSSSVDMLMTERIIVDIQQTSCCIVGGGPTGAVLALALARQGVAVTLLEAHKSFDRDFRGDIIHAKAMEIMDELGVTERLLQEVPHTKTDKIEFMTPEQSVTFADFSRLKSRHPYATIIPQAKFLEFLTTEAKRYPNFQIIMGANVQQLIEEDGIISGVRYRGNGGWHEVRAKLVVGADGRFSRIRQLAGMQQDKTTAPMDLLWLRLPRHSQEPQGLIARFGAKRVIVMYNTHDDNWQFAYLIRKGYYNQLLAAGIEALQASIVEIVPEFSDRVHHIKDWKQASLLSVDIGCLKQWFRPGLLFIGDSAHVISPVGGVGINYAIQDAATAANILTEPLKKGEVKLSHLAQIQRRRESSVRILQAFQSFIQTNITAKALQSDNTLKLPYYLKLPILRDIPAQLLAFGLFPSHLKIKSNSQTMVEKTGSGYSTFLN
ncbi:NAD(P)-binding protein [Scytonema sp. UIC 10036]|uniref:FAD-dependent oxidoreductase n=1 Tax=Scytonema sp. UIC 10036 TaxID=2304196 RepID=UPI0012DA07F1|nr:FAD-dependent oxidoreductase [Scytonema sp. UIC 10036]MUH00678.1 NAD(P)-binding protein [Scytonema sp. UIC 10036]